MAELGDSDLKKKVLLGVFLLAGVGYLGHEYAYRPRVEAIEALESRLEALQAQNHTARVLTEQEGTEALERRLGAYREQLTRVEGLIPLTEELPDLLDAIAVEAQRTGVELALIRPIGAVAEEFYTRRSYDLAVLGSFHQVGEFLTRVGSLPRIVAPTSLNMLVRNEDTRSGEPQLEAKFAIETYVLPTPTPAADAIQE